MAESDEHMFYHEEEARLYIVHMVFNELEGTLFLGVFLPVPGHFYMHETVSQSFRWVCSKL